MLHRCTHRPTNPGAIDLEMIEVQSGEYLGEDGIVGFTDSYGRVPAASDCTGRFFCPRLLARIPGYAHTLDTALPALAHHQW
jgi:mannose-1-phosphate guanylyltransferase